MPEGKTSGGGRSTWLVLADAVGKELCLPEMGLSGRTLLTARPRCCLHPARRPSAEELCRRAAGTFPAGKWGEVTLPLSPAEHGWGDMTFWMSRAGFLLPAAACAASCKGGNQQIWFLGLGRGGLKVSN